MLDRLAQECELRASFKDLENHTMHTKGCIEDLTKELMLKASIKELC